VAEALPGFEVVGWYGVIGPAWTPRADRHAASANSSRSSRPDVHEQRIAADGTEPTGTSPEEFRQFMLADLAGVGEGRERERREAGLMDGTRHDGSLDSGLELRVLAPLLWAAAIAFADTPEPASAISRSNQRARRTRQLHRAVDAYGAFVATGLMHPAFAGALLAVIFRSAGSASSPRY
jgi:hypothetical protein